MIFTEYKKETEGAVVNISQAITFVFKQLKRICTNIQAQKSMKNSDYNFCKNSSDTIKLRRRKAYD
jgi:RNA polymerase-binding transcription factor DksA